jgi:two-component system response regulator HydG
LVTAKFGSFDVMKSESPSAELLSLVETYREPAVLLSVDYAILAANSAYRLLYGDQGPESKHCYEVSHHYTLPCDRAGESCPLRACVESGQPQRVFHLHHTPQGEEHVDVELYPITGADGLPRYFLEVMRNSHLASTSPQGSGLIGRSRRFNQVLELVQRVALSDTAVLLLGESGTGKELIAQAIHRASVHADGPFVPVECSGLTETLFESELFGHEKGAFTGAQSRKIGLVEAARGGTLFLDEIGDVPISLQVKLLRLLETRTFRRVGGVEPQRAEFRLICATHRNIKQMVAAGEFRMDLFYRINTFPIELPALRERPEDLPLLIEGLLERVASQRGMRFSEEAIACLRGYDFPGNVRELRNVVERAVLLCDGDLIGPEHLPSECFPGASGGFTAQCGAMTLLPLEEMERNYLRLVLATFQGDKRELAERLGVSERTLYRKLQGVREGDEG